MTALGHQKRRFWHPMTSQGFLGNENLDHGPPGKGIKLLFTANVWLFFLMYFLLSSRFRGCKLRCSWQSCTWHGPGISPDSSWICLKCFEETKGIIPNGGLHSWSLTCPPWKMMLGRQAFPFGARSLFRGELLNFRSVMVIYHSIKH